MIPATPDDGESTRRRRLLECEQPCYSARLASVSHTAASFLHLHLDSLKLLRHLTTTNESETYTGADIYRAMSIRHFMSRHLASGGARNGVPALGIR